MKVQYGDSCLSQGRMYEWVERFQNGSQNVSDEHRSGRPVSVATETVKQQIKQRIRDYRRVTIDRIAVEFNMSHDSAYTIVRDDLGYRKACSRWFRRQLSDDCKRARQTICQEHLDHHACEGDVFLHRIVTGDESWVYHYEPESKRQSMRWKHLSSPANKQFKTQASTGKVMLTIFWNVSGPILVHFQEKGQTVTSARYSDTRVNELKPAIRLKCRRLLSKRVLLLHNNAHPIWLCIQWINYVLWNLRCWNIHQQSGLGAIGLSLDWTYERTFAGPEVCRWRGNGGSAKLVKGHTKKLFPRGHPQACGQVDQVCCEARELYRKISHKQFL